MNSILVSLMVTNHNHREHMHKRRRYTSYKNDAIQERKNKIAQKLLLEGERETMKISNNQTIKTVKYKRQFSIYNNHVWIIGSRSKELATPFEDGLKEIIELYHPKEIQMIPSKVENDEVCEYEIVMVVDKEENANKNTEE